MNKLALATIIITPRERYAIAARNLESIYRNTPKHYPVISVLGGATPSVSQHLSALCAAYGYELILKPEFLTPNEARNIGIAKATTRYIIFIENDVVVEENWIDALIQCAEEENADCVSPLCLIGEPLNRNVHSFGGKLVFENDLLREKHHLGPICLKKYPVELKRLESDYSEFHCALVRRSVFNQIGLLDENIKGAAEHIDLALHMRKLNCRGFSEPRAVVSYLPADYTLADVGTYALRWSLAWYYPTMKHLAEKWSLSSRSLLFSDYHSSFMELRERCLLKQEWPNEKLPTQAKDMTVAQTITQLFRQMSNLGYSLDVQGKIQNAYQIACELFAASFRASGKTFIAHLVGTGSILASFGANPAVISAGMLHAAYQSGRFPAGIESINAMRRWLKRRIGGAVENLVYQYSWLKLDDALKYQSENNDDMPVEMAHVILIRIANAIEDRIDGHARFSPLEWLQKSNDGISQWLDVFDAIGKRLGMSGLVSILKETVEISKTDRDSEIKPISAFNYSIQLDTGCMHPLPARNILHPEMTRTIHQQNHFSPASYHLNIRNIVSYEGRKSQVSHHKDHVRLVLDPEPWSYSARLPIEKNPRIASEQRMLIEIMLHVECGSMGVLLLERGSTKHLIAPEQNINETNAPVKVCFEIDSLEEAENIVIRSWPNDKGQVMGKIFSVKLMSA